MREKTMYLPEAENDLIFAFLGNGWLLLVVALLLGLAGWTVWRMKKK